MPRKKKEALPEEVENKELEKALEEEEMVSDTEPEVDDADVEEVPEEENEVETPKKDTKKQKRSQVIAEKRDNEIKREKKNAEREHRLMSWEQLKTAQHNRTILKSRIIAIEVLNDSIVVANVIYNGFKIVIPCSEMFAASPLDEATVVNVTDRKRREKQMLSKLLGGEIPFIITNIEGTSKDYAIGASRKEAINRMATRNFDMHNGVSRINEDDIVEASIISVGFHAVRANVGGIDMSIPIWRLTHHYVADANDNYKAGQILNVTIKRIDRDEKGHCTGLIVSGKDAEIEDFIPRLVTVSPGMLVIGTITHISEVQDDSGKTRIMLFLDDVGIPAMALYAKIDTLDDPPVTGDKVVFSIYRSYEERGIVIGNIIRRL